MARYIDANLLLNSLCNKTFVAELHGDDWDGQTVNNLLCLGDVRDEIDKLAAADVQEAVHGEWMPERAISLKLTAYRCTECRNIYTAMTRYCPACGAKMDGGNDEPTT